MIGKYSELLVQAASWQNICRMADMPVTSSALVVYEAIKAPKPDKDREQGK